MQRAGTTWWYGLIGDHPAVRRPATARRRLRPLERSSLDASIPASTSRAPSKELHFFDSFCDLQPTEEQVALYRRFFTRPEGVIVGEWTPRYMHDFWTPPLLAAAAPRAKILVLLRDPVERFRSGLERMRARVGLTGAPLPQAAWNEALERGRYASQLELLFTHFRREQVLVLQYERCLQDPASELRRTYEFLGLGDAGHTPPRLHATTGTTPKQPLPEHVMRSLASSLAVEVRRTAELCEGIDLELWPNFGAASCFPRT